MQGASDLASTALLIHGGSNVEDIRVEFKNWAILISILNVIMYMQRTYLM